MEKMDYIKKLVKFGKYPQAEKIIEILNNIEESELHIKAMNLILSFNIDSSDCDRLKFLLNLAENIDNFPSEKIKNINFRLQKSKNNNLQ